MSKAQVSVLTLEGVITNKVSDEFQERLARASCYADAHIFQIDSSGGLVVPSKEIADAIKNKKGFTVAQIRGNGTSGAYWVASACKKIVANDMSMVGSIGVRSGYLQFSDFFKRLGIQYQDLNQGEFKGAGNPFSELTDEQKEYIKGLMKESHEYFINEIAKNRNLPVDEVRKIADGKVFHGYKAKEMGLVDVLGDFATAKDLCKKELGTEVRTRLYAPKISFLQALIGK